MKSTRSVIILSCTVASTTAAFTSTTTPCFVGSTSATASSSTSLQMGLFDGIKGAFTAPALETTSIDTERETPIDRWMGWNVAPQNPTEEVSVIRDACKLHVLGVFEIPLYICLALFMVIN